MDDNSKKRYLVTGVAGFIGMHVTKKLLSQGHDVIGIDILSDYYDVTLKQARLKHIEDIIFTQNAGQRINDTTTYEFKKLDLCDRQALTSIFETYKPQRVINLAAQAGVRYSLENPHSYIDSNIVGFMNILEACRHFSVEHLVYASSSSVYGLNDAGTAFHEGMNVDHPVSLYAATKKANESMAHCYAHLYGVPTTGLRFFTVYGPWGRPDMALFKFTQAILSGKSIDIFNHGKMVRDFTYIDDIVDGVVQISKKHACADAAFDASHPDAGTSNVPWRVFNIGNGQPAQLMEYIEAIERCTQKTAVKNFMDMQPGDVVATSADRTRLQDWIGFSPDTPIEVGVARFVEWFRSYYGYE